MTVDSPILVCVRLADMPEPPVPSLPNFCSLCGWRVWVSLTSPPIETIWCAHCAADTVKAGDRFCATEATLAEVAAYRKRMNS